MDLIKQYVKKRKGSYFMSILLAIIGVVTGLFSYIYMAKIIVNLINGVSDMNLYTPLCISILITFVIKEVAAGISTSISCLLYTSPSPRDRTRSRMPSSA